MGGRDPLTDGSGKASDDWAAMERLVESFLAEVRRGERPDISRYAERHPDLAERIREMFPALLLLEEMGDGDEGGESDPQVDRPEKVGDYRILREIGRGGMGIVYEAIQESLDRRVALKILPAPSLLSPGHRRRFHREAQSAARLQHSNIVPVFGVGEFDGVHYYAMQFIHGQSLDKVVRELRVLRRVAEEGSEEKTGPVAGGLLTGSLRIESQIGSVEETATSPLPHPLTRESDVGSKSSTHHHYFRSVAGIGAQVARALDYAHREGVLHRDIKPSNLLLDAQGAVWVTDFGLAKAEGSDSLTQAGDLLGTVAYMAPERFEGWSDPRSDVYGLGLTLYELLTLRRAFEAADQARLVKQVSDERPQPPRRIDPQIPRDLETIVLTAIEPEPGKRYGTAAALLSDLELFLEGKPIQARRSGAVKRAWFWCRRNPAMAMLGTIALLLLVLVVGLSLRSARDARLQTLLVQRQLYASNIRLAGNALEQGRATVALDLLRDLPADFRGWEWEWLVRQARSTPMTLRGHEGYVYAIALSPDGERLASGGNDRTIRLWDTDSGELLCSRRAHGGRFGVQVVVYDRTGELIVSAGADHEIKIWKADTLEPVTTLGGHDHFIGCLTVSPVENVLVSGGFDHLVKVWDLEERVELRSWKAHDDIVYGVAVSPDGARLLSSGHDRRIKLWDLATGECLFSSAEQGDGVHAVAFSPDGALFATGCMDSTIGLWDASTGESLGSLDGHDAAVLHVAFTPDGKRLASVGMDERVLVWDPETRTILERMDGHRNVVRRVAFPADGSTVVTCAQDGLIKIWPEDTATSAISLQGAGASDIRAAEFDADGKLVVTGDVGGRVVIWDAGTGKIRRELSGAREGASLGSLALRSDGAQIVTGSRNGTVSLLDVASGEIVLELRARANDPGEDEEAPLSVAFGPRDRVVGAGSDGFLRIWSASTGATIREVHAHEGPVWDVALTSRGERIATAGQDGLVRVWDLEGHPVHTLRGHEDKVLSVAFSPDGRRILSGGKDSRLFLWDASSGERLRSLSGNSGWICSVAFSPDGSRIVSGGSDGSVKLWDASLGQELLAFRRDEDWIVHVAFSPDGNRILACPGWIREGNRLGSPDFEKSRANESSPRIYPVGE